MERQKEETDPKWKESMTQFFVKFAAKEAAKGNQGKDG